MWEEKENVRKHLTLFSLDKLSTSWYYVIIGCFEYEVPNGEKISCIEYGKWLRNCYGPNLLDLAVKS